MMNSGSRWLVAGLAASFLTSSLVPPANAETSAIRLAQASPRAGATVDINVFYDQLADQGTWVEHPDYRYVFIPADVGQGWRPYQQGRWVWTDNYGWYWDSDEPFAWATYHYGRWSYDPAYGWFWVPGDTWAPAWVKWRRGGGRTGWAPIAPDRVGFATGRATHYDAPIAESWVFVEDQYMGEPDVGVYAAPIPEISVYLRTATREYEPSWQDGYYVNRSIERREYDRVARTRIVDYQVVQVDRRDDLFYDDNSGRLGIYAPRIAFDDRVRPPRRVVRTIEPDRRVVVRQYVRDDTPGQFAPSAALLSALDDNRRRELREHRWSDRDRYRREMDQLERERGDRIRELRREADARSDVFERERREGIEQRRQSLERFNQERRERARSVQAPGGAPRGDQPGAGTPGGPDQPGQGRQPDRRPGTQPDSDQQRPDADQQRRQMDQQRTIQQQQDRRPGTQPDTDQQRRQPDQQRTIQQQQDRRPDAQPGRDPQRPDAGQQRQQPDQPSIQQQQDRRPGTDQQRPDADQQRRQMDQQRQQQPDRRPGTQPSDQQRPDTDQQRRQPDQRNIQQQQDRRPDAQPGRDPQRPDAGQQRQQPEQRRQQRPDAEQQRQQPDQRRQQRPDAEPQGQQRQQPEQRRQQRPDAEPQGQQQQQERRRPERPAGQQGGSPGTDDAKPDPRRQPVPPQ
jgi:hypothetical protein